MTLSDFAVLEHVFLTQLRSAIFLSVLKALQENGAENLHHLQLLQTAQSRTGRAGGSSVR